MEEGRERSVGIDRQQREGKLRQARCGRLHGHSFGQAGGGAAIVMVIVLVVIGGQSGRLAERQRQDADGRAGQLAQAHAWRHQQAQGQQDKQNSRQEQHVGAALDWYTGKVENPSGEVNAIGSSFVEGTMRAVDIIRKKRDGHALSADEIESFIDGVTRRTWPDHQASALLMASVLRGMDAEETANLTGAMVRSGQKLDWSELGGVAVDKHSTGGVGDKTSLVLTPVAGDGLLELHYRDAERLKQALPLLEGQCPITDAPPALTPLVLEVLG